MEEQGKEIEELKRKLAEAERKPDPASFNLLKQIQ